MKTVSFIPHTKQRYDTCGDWTQNGEDTHIFISDTGVDEYNLALAVHELIEETLCRIAGISEESVTAHDLLADGKRGEPGDDKNAPYRKQHRIATKLEKQLIKTLRLSWSKYNKTVNELS